MVNTDTNKESETSVLDTALQYARRGWRVFPLAGKIPFPKTHGHKDAMCDEEKIEAFWEKYRDANIGIATGRRSGIFVVDIDTKMGKHGDESLLELEDEYGSLPLTVECITASKGRHLYFRYPRDVEIYNSQSKIGEDIDVRGEGGYVVAPGSIVNGNSYEWEASCHPDNVVIADAPEWLIQLAIENSHNERFKLPEGIIPHGQQDDTLFRMACSLRTQGLSKELIEIALKQALTKCQQDPENPFTSKDIERWIKSAFSYPDNHHSDNTIQFFNDVWNADKFVEQHGNVIRNCEQLGGWFIWNGKVWEKDETHLITQLARQTVQSFSSMALQMAAGSKKQKAFLQHMKSSGNENKLGAMVELAKSNKGISVLTDEFDANPYLLNCQNGIVDLKKGCLINHDSNYLISKICNTHFDPNAGCPEWDKFLHKIFIGNNQLISFMQKIIGYSLTADVSMQMFFILYGGGNNGKSTLVETIHKVMGDYSLVTPTSTLMVKRGSEIPNDVARLKGARFVISSELESSKPLDEALVKKCTSNEPIPARFLHKEFFEFSPSAKIFLSTNYKPTIKGMDDGIWRRLRLIPFEYKFEESEKIDDFAEQYLYPEMPGILRWAVGGYQKLIKEGIKDPDIVRYATAAYKSSEDIVGAYLQEFCVIEPYCKVLVLDLYDHFKVNAGCYMSKKNFNEYLVKRGFVNDQGSAGRFKGRMTWYGIGLRADDHQEAKSEPRPF